MGGGPHPTESDALPHRPTIEEITIVLAATRIASIVKLSTASANTASLTRRSAWGIFGATDASNGALPDSEEARMISKRAAAKLLESWTHRLGHPPPSEAGPYVLPRKWALHRLYTEKYA